MGFKKKRGDLGEKCLHNKVGFSNFICSKYDNESHILLNFKTSENLNPKSQCMMTNFPVPDLFLNLHLHFMTVQSCW